MADLDMPKAFGGGEFVVDVLRDALGLESYTINAILMAAVISLNERHCNRDLNEYPAWFSETMSKVHGKAMEIGNAAQEQQQ
jgi:hypothetical protein